MRTFLSSVAQDLLRHFGSDMTKVTVVFPGKRARLFLNEELLAQATSPMWAPQYTTIGQLFDSICKAEVMETIPAICHLYNIYKEKMGDEAESMEMFWGWGEILLSDFEDIDKHMVDAHALFLNAKQLNEMDSLEFLSERQREVLTSFFSNFNPQRPTEIQARFHQLWTIMPDLYNGLRQVMPEGMMPYRGALEREAVKLLKNHAAETDDTRTYCFVGFNMLSETEKKLMQHFDRQGRARFYWDYDMMYFDNKDFEAGKFVRENITLFPNALAGQEIYNNFAQKATSRYSTTFISTSTDSIATRYIPEWLSEHLGEKESETAVVLCDEQQLLPVMHAIPDVPGYCGTPRDVNITMGYSLSGTPMFSFINALIALQTDGWDTQRKRYRYSFEKSVIRHPYFCHIKDNKDVWKRDTPPADALSLLEYLDQIVIAIAKNVQSEETMDDVLMLESIYLIHKSLRQFISYFTNSSSSALCSSLSPTTLRRLLQRALGTRSIPFDGEPAQGLQVMGVLETRCLDFRNLLLLNVGEGFLPTSGIESSLIPPTLRIGFGLTVARHRTAVFAYYFYRLIQRAEHVTCVYNENTSGNTRHEMSRFLRQLQAETDLPIRYLRLQAPQEVVQIHLDDIPKNEEILSLLHSRYVFADNRKPHFLSPSSINRYLNCRMQFYLSTICGMSVKQDPEDGIDPRMMGTIFHACAEDIYTEMRGHSKDHVITSALISAYTKNKGKALDSIIEKRIKEEAKVEQLRGEDILVKEVIKKYLINLLAWDAQRAPFTMGEMESIVSMPIDVEVGGKTITILTGGVVDRMDIITENGSTHFRILDYKTGNHGGEATKFANIFRPDHKHAGYYLQTMLYSLCAKDMGIATHPIKPVLFYPVKATNPKDYDPTLHITPEKKNKDDDSPAMPSGPIEDISNYETPFMKSIRQVIAEIFSPDVPFTKTPHHDTCQYCDFRQLCGR